MSTVCEQDVHDRVKRDSALWATLPLLGRMPGEDENGNPITLELRNHTCGSTLAKPVRAEAK